MLHPIVNWEPVPTEYAIRMRPLLIGALLALCLIIVGRFAISDFWGAISLIFVVLMGAFSLSGEYGLNATNALFFCVMAVVSGVFDVISCVLYFQHSQYSLFDTKAPFLALLAQTLFLISPVVLFISAYLGYSIFGDCRDNMSESLPILGVGTPRGSLMPIGAGYDIEAPPRQQPVQRRSERASSRSSAPSMVPFQGQPQRLSD
mmetsp:Transcript_43719/g.79786  ORF Transcript_43719/g.79786 Transcript_43719/m.79786 type:complete len:204 (-) Transcript_43719:8-619(-)